jgi:hypothetical protein
MKQPEFSIRTFTTAEAYVQELLGLPDQIKVECILGIGHPGEKKSPVAADKLEHGKIRNNGWAGNNSTGGNP